MLPVACVATHGCTLALLHVPWAFQKIAPRPHVSQHVWGSCIATHRPLGVNTHVHVADMMTCHVSIKPPRAFRSICAISVHLVNFRPAINPEYFLLPF
ncbi:hypothetical protein Bca4012_058524 [Brassica carinata]